MKFSACCFQLCILFNYSEKITAIFLKHIFRNYNLSLFAFFKKFRKTTEMKSLMLHMIFFLIYVVVSDWGLLNLKKYTSKLEPTSYSHTVLDNMERFTHVTSALIAAFFSFIIFYVPVRIIWLFFITGISTLIKFFLKKYYVTPGLVLSALIVSFFLYSMKVSMEWTWLGYYKEDTSSSNGKAWWFGSRKDREGL